MSDIGLDNKLAVVTSWLKAVFKDRAVPEFEINDQTVSALYELALKNKRRNHEQQIIIDNNNRLAQEYQDEGKLQSWSVKIANFLIAANRKEKLLEGLGLKRDKMTTGAANTYQSPYQRVFELSELLAHLTVLVREEINLLINRLTIHIAWSAQLHTNSAYVGPISAAQRTFRADPLQNGSRTTPELFANTEQDCTRGLYAC